MNLTIPEEFPFSEKERQLFKKKFLIFLAWCKNHETSVQWQQAAADKNPGIFHKWECPQDCPLKIDCGPFTPPQWCLNYLIDWIMEANID